MKIPEHQALEFRRALINAQLSTIQRCHQSFCIGLVIGVAIGALVVALMS